MDIGLTVLTKKSIRKISLLVTTIRIVSYSEVDFILEIFKINTRDDWMFEWLHVLCAIKVIFFLNLCLALNENVIQACLTRRLFLFCKKLVQETCSKNLMQVSCTTFLHKFLVTGITLSER